MVTYVSQGKFVCAFEELLLSFLESWKVIKHAVSLKGKKKRTDTNLRGHFHTNHSKRSSKQSCHI